MASFYFETIGRIATYSVAMYGAGYTLIGLFAAHSRPKIEAIEKHKEMVISEFADIKATVDAEFSGASKTASFESKHRIHGAITTSEYKIRGSLIDLSFGRSN